MKYGKADLGQMEEWPPGARHQTAVESPTVGIQWLWEGTLGWKRDPGSGSNQMDGCDKSHIIQKGLYCKFSFY